MLQIIKKKLKKEKNALGTVRSVFHKAQEKKKKLWRKNDQKFPASAKKKK